MKDAIHVVPTTYDDEGFPVWSTPLTPSENTKRALVLAAPDQVIPVIFVPGIMGSNLKLVNGVQAAELAAGAPAWRPDNAGLGGAMMSAAARQRLLNPKNTTIDTRITIGKDHWVNPPANMSLKAAEARGWGSVFWKSYGDFLTHLDSVLNAPCFYDPNIDKVLINGAFQELVSTGIPVRGQSNLKLERTELEHMSEYWFPVHAVGYNWLQSNEDAGKYLASEIRRIKALYQKKFKRPEACQKVVVITHSMGGLVTRAAVHPNMGGAADDVWGVIHGVMPALGAAAAYKRMRTGFEKDDVPSFDIGRRIVASATQAFVGNNGRDVTAVLGHAPGGLQLLPNTAYLPEGWLKITGVESQPYTVPMNSNPYNSIYREQNKWWRLINPDWLDPAMLFVKDKAKTAWDSFDTALTQAENFHAKLGHQYHPNTYSFYGNDGAHHPSYATVTWEKASNMYQGDISPLFNWHSTDVKLMKEGLAYNKAEDDRGHTGAHLGTSTSQAINFSMTEPVEAGDGTVPSISGAAPHQFASSCVRVQLSLTGIDHQGAYSTSNGTVMDFVAYSVCKIAKDAP
ncbi:esterase/lipase family protein [Collimonas pratensis]|uniref:PGAP1-like family protein n=1 Tax=Collimonas pratensis TaxID=279113 RepID=A0ABN4M654_9BURK|nr:hypothetical protein [Collimonas pratensis]AMP12842.1 PGAP1-like family protein [Collimonas pratensis]